MMLFTKHCCSVDNDFFSTAVRRRDQLRNRNTVTARRLPGSPSSPCSKDTRQILESRAPLQELVCELVPVTPEAAIAACGLIAPTDSAHSFSRQVQARPEHILLLQLRDQTCSTRHVILQND